jgi:two-component system, NarL family, nitrate/nitrite response regulator NarL
VRLVICDDHLILSEALAAALEARGHEVLAIATSVSGAISAVDEHRPDICLLDLRFAGDETGLDVVKAIRAASLPTRILVLSAVTNLDMLSTAIDLGIAGFLRKDQDLGVIADALEVVGAGGAVFDPWLRRATRPNERRRRDPFFALTPREHEVLARIVDGHSTSRMAVEMAISISTVRTYVRNVLTKLGAHSRLEAAALATRGGLRHDLSA